MRRYFFGRILNDSANIVQAARIELEFYPLWRLALHTTRKNTSLDPQGHLQLRLPDCHLGAPRTKNDKAVCVSSSIPLLSTITHP